MAITLWTPQIGGDQNLGTVTATFSNGWFEVDANGICYFGFSTLITAWSGQAGNIIVSSAGALPACVAGAGNGGGGFINNFGGITYPDNVLEMALKILPGSQNLALVGHGSGVPDTAIPVSFLTGPFNTNTATGASVFMDASGFYRTL